MGTGILGLSLSLMSREPGGGGDVDTHRDGGSFIPGQTVIQYVDPQHVRSSVRLHVHPFLVASVSSVHRWG